MKITFIIGGARSGKSAFALKEASKTDGRKAFIATAQAFDEEMKERISKHQEERGPGWDTYEEPVKIADTLSNLGSNYNVVLLDCLTLWLSNLMLNNVVIDKEIDALINILRKERTYRDTTLQLVLVSNEVGMGIVPENKLARQFRDLAGMLNQKVAEIADDIYMVTAGIPVKIK